MKNKNHDNTPPAPVAADDDGLGHISVIGARVHNLKNIDVDIPHNKLTVVTGLSGSGKSSLAFDTIFAEGQRRYIETFSAYARNLIGGLERPDVDKISGLCPVIAIEQKTINRNPRSTIGTTTEIYDFLRLLYARAGKARSYITGKDMVKYSPEDITRLIVERYEGKRVYILAPQVKNRKGHYRELFERLIKKGFLHARIDGEICELAPGMKLDRYRNHSVEIVIDRLAVKPSDHERILKSVEKALEYGGKEMMLVDADSDSPVYFSQELMDAESGISYHDPAPHNFSFNSPQGACPRCKGLGYVDIVDREKIIPDPSLSIAAGGLAPVGKYKDNLVFRQLKEIVERYDASLRTPIADLPEEALDEILHGAPFGSSAVGVTAFEGLVKYIQQQLDDDDAPAALKKWSGKFFTRTECPECHGDRLNREALHFFIDGKNIAELTRMSIGELYEWSCGVIERLKDARTKAVAAEIIKEIRSRLHFLVSVGLDYLQLARSSSTLSGGESQRIRLATQLGSELVNVLYILDEPSIGLHQRDNHRLIESLKNLRDASNTIIVVEHDEDIMRQADYIVDIGPGAGRKGGEVVFAGTPEQMLETDTFTAGFLNGTRQKYLPAMRREGSGKHLVLKGARGHNLRDVTLDIPLGTFTCVAGVSGSGKSSLVSSTLQPILARHFFRAETEPLPYESIEGLENIDKVVTVDQSPLGRTPRSNPATYTGVFTDIRALFVGLPEAKIRGYKPGRFSFNVAGGRCEVCKGNGYKTIEMNFLPDILVPCEECGGKRYNRETLEVRYKGRSIADVLDMTINQVVEFFAGVPHILKKIKVLQEIGLGYLKLGQPSSTLSGGENQRVKLATELARRDTGKTLFILDEPTTGLHFEDVNTLLTLLNRLVDRGNTVLVVEHNTDVLRAADHIIDMGPGGGRHGGTIVAQGTPEAIAATGSPTAPYLR